MWLTAAAWIIFAPMQLCTGGGGGSWPEVVTLEGGGMEPRGGTRGGIWQAIPPLDSICWDDMSVWLAEIFF